MRSCDFPRCGKAHEARGYCGAHYQQLMSGARLRPIRPYNKGSVSERIKARATPMPSGCVEWAGSHDTHGYAQINVEGEIRRVHRVMWEAEVGVPGPGRVVDHACGNRGCLSMAHLREVSHEENIQYRTAVQRNNTSGHRGVSFRADTGKWAAVVTLGGVTYRLGQHATASEAGMAAERFRRDNYKLGEIADFERAE